MKVSVYTLGCKVNQYESHVMRSVFESEGYTFVNIEDSPDVVVVNSCTVTAESDRKTKQAIRKFRRLLPNAIIVLTGCMPQAFPEQSALVMEADIIIGNKNSSAIPQLVKKFCENKQRIIQIAPIINNEKMFKQELFDFHEKTRAFVKIEDGCDRFCTYCIIPYARGRVKSKSTEEIIQEINRLVALSYSEVVLVGINLSDYGKDIGLCLADAIEAVNSISGVKRIRLGSLDPDRIDDETISRLMMCDKLCPQFHLSLQSGCDLTLKRMNRHYTAEDYKILVNKLRNAFTDCSITTDIMVGFPGETEEDFEASKTFAEEIQFARTHVFAYSKREGTPASKYLNQLSKEEKAHRSATMISTTAKSEKFFMESQIDKVFPVLFESKSIDGLFEGYTPNYTHVRVNSKDNLHGKIINVKITHSFDEYCIGHIQV